jgi:hypothetical protein
MRQRQEMTKKNSIRIIEFLNNQGDELFSENGLLFRGFYEK